jgi:hypothetical protein
MQRHELEHLIRAAGAITGAEEIIVIGSQSILGALPDAPTSLLRSCEADVFTLRDPKDADLIDGSIGEGSPFHETFGYYAQGVWLDTAVLPDGWISRCVEIRNSNTNQVTARCLDPHDLAVSKLVAGREKDLEFLVEMVRNGIIEETTLLHRISLLSAHQTTAADLRARWTRILKKASAEPREPT